jgi:hypothetical protein
MLSVKSTRPPTRCFWQHGTGAKRIGTQLSRKNPEAAVHGNEFRFSKISF